MVRFIICFLILLLAGCSYKLPDTSSVVVLDIGHFIGAPGASAPGPVNGKRLEECAFWYQYAYEVKRTIEKAGYACVVTNRGNAPTQEPLAGYARRAQVVHLRHPDVNARRYPSHYHPDRVASGMVSADYAIYRRASCIVFLHHNSSNSRWTKGGSPSIVLCNKYNGRPLADTLCHALNTEILDHGMANGGRLCRPQVRSVDADRAAGWLNACDDSGIPAAVIEAAFLNNRDHAAFLSQEENARRYAQTIGRGIVSYLKNYGHTARHKRADENTPDEGSFGYARESRGLVVPGAKHLLP